jgi:hypothetical protein
MTKEERKLLKGALELSILNSYRKFGGYVDVKVVNIKKYDDVYLFDRTLYFEDGNERSNDCEIDIDRANELVNQYKTINQ